MIRISFRSPSTIATQRSVALCKFPEEDRIRPERHCKGLELLRQLRISRFLQLLHGDGLRARAVRGSCWTIAGFGTQQVLRLGSNLILTRLLFPEAFGLMALAQIFMIGLQMFSDIGIRPSIIQNPNSNDPEFLNTAWTIQIVRGIFLWLFACIIAYPASTYYDSPALFPVLCFIGSTAAIQGFQTTGLATSSKKLVLGKMTLIELASQTTGIVVMVAWAAANATIWALVAGGVTTSFVNLVLSHRFLNTHTHALHWNRSHAAELIKFGKWIFLSSVLTFIAQSGDRLLLPKVLSLPDLSFYTIAIMLSQLPTRVFGQISVRVLFPLFAETLNSGLSEKTSRAIQRFAIISMPLYLVNALFILYAEEIIAVLYDPRYQSAGGALSILAVGGFLKMVRASQEGLLLAAGNSRGHMIVNLVRCFVWIPLAIPLSQRWGLEGFCSAIVIADAITLLTQRRFTRRVLPSLSPLLDQCLLGVLLLILALEAVLVST